MFYLWKRLWAVGCRLLSCRLAALCSCTRLTLTITHLQLIAACTSALRTLQSIQVFLLFSLILFKSDNSGVFRTIVMRIVEIHPDSSAAALCLKSQVSCFITQSCLSLRTLSLSFQLKGGPGARWGGVMCLIQPGNTSWSRRRSCKMGLTSTQTQSSSGGAS